LFFMNWIPLTTETQLQQLTAFSATRPQVIYKHSTRCGISSLAKSRLERQYQPTDIDFHYLDLIAHRPLSNAIAERFKIHHESPQVLLIKNGICVYNESHSGISMNDIVDANGLRADGVI